MSHGIRSRSGDRRGGCARKRLVRVCPTSNTAARPRRSVRAGPVGLLIPCLALLGGTPPQVEAQATEPLTKSEVLRLLATDVYSSEELAELLLASCVTFEATQRDRADLRSLGATDRVLEALGACREGGGGPPAAPPPGAGAPAAETREPAETREGVETREAGKPDPGRTGETGAETGEIRTGEPDAPRAPTARLQPASLALTAGTSGSVVVEVTRDGRALPGLELLLGGPGSPAGDALRATTDAGGRASFRIVAGPVARLYQLPLRSADGRLPEGSALHLEVRPGPPARTRLSPELLRLDPGSETTLRLIADVTDGFGNPVPGEALELATAEGAVVEGAVVAAAVTDARGQAALIFASTAITGATRLILRAAGRILAEIPVERGSPEGAPAPVR